MLIKVLAQMVKNCMDTKLAGVTVQTGETYYVICYVTSIANMQTVFEIFFCAYIFCLQTVILKRK